MQGCCIFASDNNCLTKFIYSNERLIDNPKQDL